MLPLHPRQSTTTTTAPAQPPPSPQRPWPLPRLPTFRPTPTTPDPLSPPRRASIPHLLSSSASTDAVPLRRHHPVSPTQTTNTRQPRPRSTSNPPRRLQHNTAAAEILIVDDNPLNVRLLSAFLTKHGFPDHVSAPNGLEAVRLFKEAPRRWAAILMDLSMPVMDGATATREIRAWEKYLVGRARKGGRKGGGVVNGVVDGEGRDATTTTATAVGEREQPAREKMVDQQRHSAHEPNGIAVREEHNNADAGAGTGGVQIIVTTGLGSATARFEALSAGADEYMTKPIQFGALMKMLNKRVQDRAAAAAAPDS